MIQADDKPDWIEEQVVGMFQISQFPLPDDEEVVP